MVIKIRRIAAITCIALAACASEAANTDSCSPLGMNEAQLLTLKANEWDAKHPGAIAIALADCLGDPDPNIRDGIAYEGLAHWLRSGALTETDIRELKDKLVTALKIPDDAGFYAPFAALVLSEVARVDRVAPYLSPEERTAFTAEAAKYMTGITDYRGYDDAEGWRHNIAHTADWLMQIALNPETSKMDILALRDAISAQIAPSEHAYIHGESARLARPILFAAMRDDMTEGEWTDWLTDLTDPAPMENWNAAFQSEAGLTRLHNLKAFLNSVYVNASASSNENLKRLLPGTETALRALP